MSYTRVIPRDLFNEANLLKCYGQLYLKLEPYLGQQVNFELVGDEFEIDQNTDDGSLTIITIDLDIRDQHYELYRPLNSREPWPLYATRDERVYEVFTPYGELSLEFLGLIHSSPFLHLYK